MPRKSSRKQKPRKKVKQSVKKAGMMKAAKKLAKKVFNTRSFEEKLEDDITELIEYAPIGKKKELQQKIYTAHILNEDEENEFKNKLYKISNKIAMLDVTNLNKQLFLKLFRRNLVKILGNNELSQQAIDKLVEPILQSSRNNAELAEEFAKLNLSNARKAHNKTMRGLNSRLRRTNGATAAFLDPRMLTTTTTNNGFEEVRVARPGETNVNQSEINNIMEEARAQALYNNMPKVPTTIFRSKGGYRKIKKSRKRVYA